MATATKRPHLSKIPFATFKGDKKVVYASSDPVDYEEFKKNWEETHDEDEPCPEDGSQEYWNRVNDDSQLEWEDFKDNFKYSPLIGRVLLFEGAYDSRYPDFRPSHGSVGVSDEIKDLDHFIRTFAGRDPDKIDIYIDETGLHATHSHHDGSSSYTVSMLTRKGEQWLKNKELTADNIKHLHETKGLLRKIDFFLF